MRHFLIIALIPLATYASDEVEFNCNAYYGLNMCESTFELNDDQINFSEKDENAFEAKIEQHNPSFRTSLSDEEMNQVEKKNAFKNTDSFRAYMKTLEDPGRKGDSGEFSVKTRILDSTNFGLDCRLVANSIYELSSENYYDCALERYF